jgi:chemotaxis protein CheD
VTEHDETALDELKDPMVVEVGVGELATAQHPRYLMTPALGSCIGLALWDSALKQGGLAHVMLPSPPDNTRVDDERRFASYAVPLLVKMLAEVGSPRRRLEAKLAGGAAMFRSDTTLATIGSRNLAEVKDQLGLLNIPVVAEDTGESHARTVELHLDTGQFVVRSYMYGVRRL